MDKNKGIELATYIIVPFSMWVVLTLLGKLLDSFYFPYPNLFAKSIPIIIGGILLLLCGTALAFWTIYLFKTKGQGTPNPKLPPKVFIASGPYSFSRNRMALGGFLILLGEAALYYSPSLCVIAILYGLILYTYVRFVEEPVLKERFGDPYRDYLDRVPRFFPYPWKRTR